MVNAGLAVKLVSTWEQGRLAAGKATHGAAARLEVLARGVLPAEYAAGLESVAWAGRSQVSIWHGRALMTCSLDGSRKHEEKLE